jgi:hypothetical protein
MLLSCPQTTSNARNEAMFKEATVFAQHLRVVEKELNQWQRDIECRQQHTSHSSSGSGNQYCSCDKSCISAATQLCNQEQVL